MERMEMKVMGFSCLFIYKLKKKKKNKTTKKKKKKKKKKNYVCIFSLWKWARPQISDEAVTHALHFTFEMTCILYSTVCIVNVFI
jgi:hypothetical protein